MGHNYKWLHYMEKTPDGEQFLLVRRRARTGKAHINFWHIQEDHTTLYTFLSNAKIKRKKEWDIEELRQLEEKLRSPKPCAHVIRFAFDGKTIFSEDGNTQIPQIPEPPGTIREKQEYIMFGKFKGTEIEKSWRLGQKMAGVVPGQLVAVPGKRGARLVIVTRVEPADSEDLPGTYAFKAFEKEEEFEEFLKAKEIKKHEQTKKKEAEKGVVLAPYILYGQFRDNSKEYAWNLTPDKPKRQGIEPGDRVVVWTNEMYAIATVTRIEKRDGRKKKQPKPTARVRCKVFNSKQTPPDET